MSFKAIAIGNKTQLPEYVPPVTGTPITGAMEITQPGTYYIANDFVASGYAILISTSDVIINLNLKTVGFNTNNANDMYGIHSTNVNNNIEIYNGFIVHSGLGTLCTAIGIRGLNWHIHAVAIDDNKADSFIGVRNYNPGYVGAVAAGFLFHDNYVQIRGNGTGTTTNPIPLSIEHRGSDAYCEIYNNRCVESHAGISISFWGMSAIPTKLSLVYKNQVSTNRVENVKSPYCIALGRSRMVHIYHNRVTAKNGRGVVFDGLGSGTLYPWCTNNILEENAIGAVYGPADKIIEGGFSAESSYGLRIRYHSGYNDITRNTIMTENHAPSGNTDNAAIYIGSDPDSDDPDMIELNLLGNTAITRVTNDRFNTPFYWQTLDEVTLTDNKWHNEIGTKDEFAWVVPPVHDPAGNYDVRRSVIETGSVRYEPIEEAPTAVTGITLTKYFDSYFIEWDENPQECVWKYRIYRDGVKIGLDILSCRAPSLEVPRPFISDVDVFGSVVYEVSAVSLGGVEGPRSVMAYSDNASRGIIDGK